MTSPAAWAFALVVGAPMWAEAQQGGLFPVAPGHRRQRVPCNMEDPVYGLYRHEYYGYHPTCWRKFPAGWGCPSPEAPNAAAEFQKLPRDKPPQPYGNEPEQGEMEPEGPGRALPRENLPLPNGGRSPFEMDPKPGDVTPPPADAPPGGGNLLPPPADAKPDQPGAAGGENQPPPTGLLETPMDPGSDNGPLLALPDPAAPPPAAAAPTAPPATAVPSTPTASAVPSTPTASAAPSARMAPALGAPGQLPPGVNQGNPLMVPGPAAYAPRPVQAPRRTSLLGGLFGGSNRNRR